jgi:hypothetical protein
MKIGVYGDSYTVLNTGPGSNDSVGLSWVEHLSQIHEVKNFGQSGTAFSWSYQLFLENQKQFDLNIVVVSDPARLYIKSLDSHPKKPPGHLFTQKEFIQEFKRRVGRDDETFNILDSINVWVEKCRDRQFENHLHRLMVNNVLSFNNVLIIPGFVDSVVDYSGNLTDLQTWELLQVAPSFNNFDNMKDLRKCHLTEKNNQILFDLVVDAINQKEKILKIDLGFFEKPDKTLDYYISIWD